MRVLLVLALVLGYCTAARGQLTPEEAYQKLQEKKKQEAAAAASQPAQEQGSPRPSGEAVGRMIHQGWDILMAHRYADALVVFDKVVGTDARDSVALEGRGICKYELTQYKPADQDLERAYAISSVGGPTRIPRQLAIASAAALLMNDNPMRAVKMLRETMEAKESNGKLDEELENDLGIALSHVNAQARKLPLFQDSLNYYMAYDKKLDEQKHDGNARWGTQWIEKKPAEEKWKEYKQAAERADKATTNYQHASLERAHAYENYLEVVGGLRLHGTLETLQRTNEYKQSKLVEAAALKQMNEAIEHLNKVDKPPFPKRIEHNWEEPR